MNFHRCNLRSDTDKYFQYPEASLMTCPAPTQYHHIQLMESCTSLLFCLFSLITASVRVSMFQVIVVCSFFYYGRESHYMKIPQFVYPTICCLSGKLFLFLSQKPSPICCSLWEDFQPIMYLYIREGCNVSGTQGTQKRQ